MAGAQIFLFRAVIGTVLDRDDPGDLGFKLKKRVIKPVNMDLRCRLPVAKL